MREIAFEDSGVAEIDGTAMRDGKPMSGAMIVLVPRNPGNSTVLFRRDQSDSDGTFTLSDIVPGQVNLSGVESRSIFTDDSGSFAFSNVISGYLALQARRPGFFMERPKMLDTTKSLEYEIKLMPFSVVYGRITKRSRRASRTRHRPGVEVSSFKRTPSVVASRRRRHR